MTLGRRCAVLVALCASLVSLPASRAAQKGERAHRLGPSTESLFRAVSRGPDDPLASAGSRSVGACADGLLVDSAELPLDGEGYRVFPSFRARSLHFGTDELVAAIQRVARKLIAGSADPSDPTRVIQIGNLSGRFGGPIRYSHSHQAGRDVDIAFLATDRTGAPALPDDLVHFRCRGGVGRKPYTDLRFDVARNWALVAALLLDESVEIQAMYIAPCLRRRLLDHAEAIGADTTLRAHAASVLREAGGTSSVHDDHLHVRIYCSRGDLLTGCRNEGLLWPWIRTHEERLAAERVLLRHRLASADPEERIHALREIASLDAKPLARAVVRLLDDPQPAVRSAALETTAALASPRVLFLLRDRLTRSREPTHVMELLNTLMAFEGPSPSTATLLEEILDDPGHALRARLTPEEQLAVRIRAARSLGFLGRRASVWHLIRRLADESPKLRVAAESALSYLTNRAPRVGLRDDARALRRDWRRWWSDARTHARWRNIRAGFRAVGLHIPRGLIHSSAIRPLFSAVARGGYLSWNAQVALRVFARENAPRIPHDRPVAALPLWRAWLGSRLPVGALGAGAVEPRSAP